MSFKTYKNKKTVIMRLHNGSFFLFKIKNLGYTNNNCIFGEGEYDDS